MKSNFNPSLLTREKVAIVKNFIESKYCPEKLTDQTPKRSDSPLKHSKYRDWIKKHHSIIEFESLCTIGKGSTGEVRLVKEKRTGKSYAMKVMKKSELLKRDQVFHIRMERDILVLGEGNPWIVQLHVSFQDDKFLYLVMEYVPGGDLMNLLIKRGTLYEYEVKFYMAEILMCIDSLHKLNCIHRDLKPDNILIDKDGHIKISDFGLSKLHGTESTIFNFDFSPPSSPRGACQPNGHWKTNVREKLFSIVGSINYIAPKVLNREGYSYECDWWSFGIILYETLYGHPPFWGDDPKSTTHKIINWKKYLEIPKTDFISDEAIDLMKKLICDPKDRLKTFNDLRSHRFFNEIDFPHLRDMDPPFVPALENDWDHSHFDEFEMDKTFDDLVSLKDKTSLQFYRDGYELFFGFEYVNEQVNESETEYKDVK